MNHYTEARELMQDFPEETEGYNLLEIGQLWESYSDTFEVGWVDPTKEDVKEVFKKP